MEIKQYAVHWINLDPVKGSEVSKIWPCVVISPNEMNRYLKTVIVAPLTHTIKPYPSRVNCEVGGKKGSVMLDQIRTVNRLRIREAFNKLKEEEINNIKYVINQMFC